MPDSTQTCPKSTSDGGEIRVKGASDGREIRVKVYRTAEKIRAERDDGKI